MLRLWNGTRRHDDVSFAASGMDSLLYSSIPSALHSLSVLEVVAVKGIERSVFPDCRKREHACGQSGNAFRAGRYTDSVVSTDCGRSCDLLLAHC